MKNFEKVHLPVKLAREEFLKFCPWTKLATREDFVKKHQLNDYEPVINFGFKISRVPFSSRKKKNTDLYFKKKKTYVGFFAHNNGKFLPNIGSFWTT